MNLWHKNTQNSCRSPHWSSGLKCNHSITTELSKLKWRLENSHFYYLLYWINVLNEYLIESTDFDPFNISGKPQPTHCKIEEGTNANITFWWNLKYIDLEILCFWNHISFDEPNSSIDCCLGSIFFFDGRTRHGPFLSFLIDPTWL